MTDSRIPATPTPDDDDEIKVAPAEGESAADVLMRLEQEEHRRRWRESSAASHKAAEEKDEDETEDGDPLPGKYTFTLSQLMLAIVVLSVVFGIMKALGGFSKTIVGGVTGLAALAGLFIISSQEELTGILRLAWWALLVTYVGASIFAILAG